MAGPGANFAGEIGQELEEPSDFLLPDVSTRTASQQWLHELDVLCEQCVLRVRVR